MIRTTFLAALLTSALTLSASATPQSPRAGVNLSFDRHGVSGVSFDWRSRGRGQGRRYGRAGSIARPRYDNVYAQSPRYEWRIERVWIPASRQKVWNEPVIRVDYDSCGRRFETVVRTGRWTIESTPGHFEERKVRVRVSPTIVRRY